MPFTILVLCTGNSARSILGEAVLERQGKGRIKAYSAGSHPKNEPHPATLHLLKSEGFVSTAFYSKSWDVFASSGAVKIDLVLTVCDSAAGESCPYFPGTPLRSHWGLQDPAASVGSEQQVADAFRKTYDELMLRADALMALPFETMQPFELQAALQTIGGMEGATHLA